MRPQKLRLSFLIALTWATAFYLWLAQGTAAEVLRFKLLPEDSTILTEVSHPFGPVKGKFTVRQGEASGDPRDLKNTGQVKIALGTSSYDSGFAPRDHDVIENYLEANVYPEIVFTSTAIEDVQRLGSSHNTWEMKVRASLKLHGREKEVQIPVTLTWREKRIIVEGTTTIRLQDFDIAVPQLLFIRSGDAARVSFRFVAEQS